MEAKPGRVRIDPEKIDAKLDPERARLVASYDASRIASKPGAPPHTCRATFTPRAFSEGRRGRRRVRRAELHAREWRALLGP